MDVTNIYYYLKGHGKQKKLPKETKSLATICEELLSVFLSKVSIDQLSYLHFGTLICQNWHAVVDKWLSAYKSAKHRNWLYCPKLCGFVK